MDWLLHKSVTRKLIILDRGCIQHSVQNVPNARMPNSQVKHPRQQQNGFKRLLIAQITGNINKTKCKWLRAKCELESKMSSYLDACDRWKTPNWAGRVLRAFQTITNGSSAEIIVVEQVQRLFHHVVQPKIGPWQQWQPPTTFGNLILETTHPMGAYYYQLLYNG